MATFTPGAIRQGLPRIPSGPPWPETPGSVTASGSPADAGASPQTLSEPTTLSPSVCDEAAPLQELRDGAVIRPALSERSETTRGDEPSSAHTVRTEVSLRRGLPRTPGGEPWPPSGTVTVERIVLEHEHVHESVTPAPVLPEPVVAPPPQTEPPIPPALSDAETIPRASSETSDASEPPRGEQPTAAPSSATGDPRRTIGRQAKRGALLAFGAIAAAGIIVLAARGITTLPGVPEFMERYPGEYTLPAFVDDGFPPWVRWSHFLNFFFMVLIVRSGLLVRRQQKPDAYFTPKKGGKKISIYLWLHTSIDVLWLLNGVAFVVLLFVTGHWARIVPTSWEVFPNAASAMLQYLTLEWPHENGWVNYNSLQQLMYFTVVFIAAPLAAITGVRMSEWWPQNATRLNRIYPAPLARAIHYPVMLFFVLFVIVHVFLVFATGALKNLNHMFAGTPEISWLGFGWFAAGLLLTSAVAWTARPLVLAPIANLFGRVSER